MARRRRDSELVPPRFFDFRFFPDNRCSCEIPLCRDPGPAAPDRVSLGGVSIAFSGVLYRLAEVSPETASFFRCIYGLPILLAVTYFERKRSGPLPRRGVLLAAFAGVLFAGDLIFWHHAVDAVGAGLATVLGNMQVVIVAIAAWILFGERLTRGPCSPFPSSSAGWC